MRTMRHKLNYLPGMISLVLIPYLICYLALQYLAIPKERVMELNMPRKNTSEYSFSFNRTLMETKIDFLEITLTGNETEDKIKLDFAALETRRIIKENDSVHGVKLVFNDSAKYNSLIRILNIMDQEIARYYVYEDQMFWFYHVPIYNTRIYTATLMCGLVIDHKELSRGFPYYIFNGNLKWIPISLALLFLIGLISILIRFKTSA